MSEFYFADGAMEIPTPCQHCGGIFDLNDGTASEKWYPNTIICEACGRLEEAEIEKDDEISEIVEQLDNAYYDVQSGLNTLKDMKFFEDMSDFDREQTIMKWRAANAKIIEFWNSINKQ
jgi:lysyl-tRNA synthetase class I